MLPRYLLLAYGPRRILALAEWDDLVPQGSMLVKPLLRGPLKNGEPAVTVAGLQLGCLRGKPETSWRGERELCRGALGTGRHDPLTGHLPCSETQIVSRWEASPLADWASESAAGVRQALREAPLSGAESLPRLLAEAQVIGSTLYAPGRANDIDLAVPCSPSEALELRTAVASLRRHERQTSSHGFLFRCHLAGQQVDLFPALPDDVPHPLRNACAWVARGPRRLNEITVTRNELGAYAWPLLALEGPSRWMLVCSNAFRGAFATGDRLTIRSRTVVVDRRDGTAMNVEVVSNPWSDIRDARSLFAFARDGRHPAV